MLAQKKVVAAGRRIAGTNKFSVSMEIDAKCPCGQPMVILSRGGTVSVTCKRGESCRR